MLHFPLSPAPHRHEMRTFLKHWWLLVHHCAHGDRQNTTVAKGAHAPLHAAAGSTRVKIKAWLSIFSKQASGHSAVSLPSRGGFPQLTIWQSCQTWRYRLLCYRSPGKASLALLSSGLHSYEMCLQNPFRHRCTLSSGRLLQGSHHMLHIKNQKAPANAHGSGNTCERHTDTDHAWDIHNDDKA